MAFKKFGTNIHVCTLITWHNMLYKVPPTVDFPLTSQSYFTFYSSVHLPKNATLLFKY